LTSFSGLGRRRDDVAFSPGGGDALKLDPINLVFQVLFLAIAAAVAGPIIARRARSTGQRWLGRLLTLSAALIFSAGALYLLRVGSRAGWTSDGPGALVIMLITAFLVISAVVCWGLLLFASSPRP
jgi:hypothetical protein